MYRRVLMSLAFAALAATPAAADESATLVELCKQYQALPKTGDVTAEFLQLKSSCAGFINSAVKMSKPEDGFCRPQHYDMDDLVARYMTWVGTHADRLNEPTKVTIAAALAEAYPCPK